MSVFYTFSISSFKKEKERFADNNFFGVLGVRFAKFDIANFSKMPSLSPPKDLLLECKKLEKEGSWNKDVFDSYYKPNFIKSLKNDDAFRDLKEIIFRLENDMDVVFLCYCSNSCICHRSIIGEFIHYKGFNVVIN